MPSFTRRELDDAFAEYQRVTERCGETRDWSPWADQFTPDAQYYEHLYGRFNGRGEIRTWIIEVLSTFPGNEMPHYPVEWYLLDDERGWVVAYIQNRMRDPGDGSIHQSPNVSILHYAGDNQWSYQEDIYNPGDFAAMIEGWQARVKELEGA